MASPRSCAWTERAGRRACTRASTRPSRSCSASRRRSRSLPAVLASRRRVLRLLALAAATAPLGERARAPLLPEEADDHADEARDEEGGRIEEGDPLAQ